MRNIPFRPITRIKDLLESIGQEMSYAYEDLVFPAHNAFLLQMGDKGHDLFVHFNQESEAGNREKLLHALKAAGAEQDLKVRFKGTYAMEESGEGELKLTFQPAGS